MCVIFKVGLRLIGFRRVVSPADVASLIRLGAEHRERFLLDADDKRSGVEYFTYYLHSRNARRI